MAPCFLGRGACEGAIVEGMRDGCFSAGADLLVEDLPMAALHKIPDMPMELIASDGGSRRHRLCGRCLRERPAGGAELRFPEEAYSPGNRWQR